MEKIIIDVREPDEFSAEHVKGSINIPLSQFDHQAPGILGGLKSKSIILMCRSGKRAGLASQQLSNLGFSDFSCEVYQGGILKWKESGEKVEASKKNHLPIMRQVQLIAGLGVLLPVVLGFLISPNFFYVSGFFGAGLSFAGLSGRCLMAEMLAMMPWNKSAPALTEELCQVSPGSKGCNEGGNL